MRNTPLAQLSRRAITGVMVLWLCVIAAGVWAPMARAGMEASSMERLCSGEPVPQWAASPMGLVEHDDAQMLHHLMECPLCLPVLAPPPDGLQPAAHAQPQPLAVAPMAAAPAAWVQQWPPARGPPAFLSVTRNMAVAPAAQHP